jgi:hypothetical protein
VGVRPKKEKHRDPLDPRQQEEGDQWDHVGLDCESRFVVSLVTDKRTPEALEEVVADFAERTGQVVPKLITTDDNAAYEPVLRAQYGKIELKRRKDGQPDKRSKPRCSWPQGAVYATVSKTYSCGKPSSVKRKLVHGTAEQLAKALGESKVSTTINTAFIERQNGTDRTHNARKARQTQCFSKELVLHLCVSWWVMVCYNFHFVHRGLRLKADDETLVHRTPAMAIGLADTPMSVEALIFTPLPGLLCVPELTPAYFKPWKRAGP